jgi:hypothetical protein
MQLSKRYDYTSPPQVIPRLFLSLIEELKNKQSPQNTSKVEGSKIGRLYMRSSAFFLWLLTLGISYGHKLPFISKIVGLLSLWYGRTSWWMILVIARKLFILINAIIGVWVVFKSVGFSSDNLYTGFIGIGHTYLEIFYSFTKRLFTWFIDLFDHKIVPNPPANPAFPKLPSFPSNIPKIDKDEPYFSLRELYMNPSNDVVSPWYKELNNWLWVAGITGGVLLIYVAYKMCTDPLFIADLFNSNNNESTPTTSNIPEISLEDVNNSNSVINGLVLGIKSVVYKLNPLNYFRSSSEISRMHNEFMENQFNYLTADKRFYPFTEVKPWASWQDKIK